MMFQQRRSFAIAILFLFGAFALVCQGCQLTQVPRDPDPNWPEPRVYADTDSQGHPFMSVRNQTAYPIIVSLSCDRTAAGDPATSTLMFDFNDSHRDVLGLRVRAYGTSAFYTPWTVNCIVTSWQIQNY